MKLFLNTRFLLLTIFITLVFGQSTLVFAAVAPDADTAGASGTSSYDLEIAEIEANRPEVIANIINSITDEAVARGYEPSWEEEMQYSLEQADSNELLAASKAEGFDEVVAVLKNGYTGPGAWQDSSTDSRSLNQTVPRVIGSKTGDLVFTPLVPCRLLDTRFGTGMFAGPIADLTTISIQTNISDFTAQGGNSGPCGMPTNIDASAIVVIVTAVNPPNTGHLRVFPFSAPFPNASVVNFVPGQDIANNTIVPQCIGCGSDISIFVATQADVIVDVIGYFDPPVQSNQSQTVFNEGPAVATGTNSVTVVSKSITVPGPGRIIAIGNADVFCDSCVVGTADGFMNISTSSTASASSAPRSFFRLVPKATNSVTRTLEFIAPSAGTHTFFLRGSRSAGSAQIGFYRGQLQLMYLPD